MKLYPGKRRILSLYERHFVAPPPILSPDAPYMPSYSGMSLGRGIQGTDLPPTSYPPPPPRPLPNPQVTLPSAPPPPSPPPLSPSVAVPPSAAVWSMPLCRVLWFFSQ